MQINLAEIQEHIEKEIIKTEQKIAGYKDMTEPVGPDNAIGRVSRMDAIVNGSIVEAALREAGQKLANLKAMKARIKDPDFGLCRKCRQPIPFKRLLLMPQIPYCIRCAG